MSRELSKLSLYMREMALDFLDQCRAEGLDIVIICTDRDSAAQAAAFASGASKAPPGRSAHNVRLPNGTPASEAFDIGVIRNGKYVKDGKDPHYQRAGAIGEAMGLRWGWRWKTIKEAAHFENPSFKPPAQ